MHARISIIAAAVLSMFLSSLTASPNSPTSDAPPTPAALRELFREFREIRRDMLDDHRQLLAQLRDAQTDEERQALIHAFREQHREQFAHARELRKEFHRRVIQIRRDRRNFREGPE